ncbi:MAG TPA: PLP-dependent aminotransferase family protein [Thermoanaerobaculia bacterium]|nr:PLP-dependent aminotransferase family protein [Thermoanaerobaculia bacterium]
MTIWSPKLPESSDPIYARIADALERDVRGGLLVAGSQLPTHRELARVLGITPVTVTRAYAEAARRGLVESATGRGTFVRAARLTAVTNDEFDLATNVVNVPLPTASRTMLDRAAAMLSAATYAAGAGSERHRAAGAVWIGRRTDPSRVIVTSGTQHALLIAFAAAARCGDAILADSVTYHGAKAAASLLGMRLEPLPFDRAGILPDALERACRGRGPKALYVMPSLHNPTGTVMPEKRRREIAAVAEKHGVTIIEDDVAGFLLDKTPPPIAAFAPDRTLFITGLGKAIAPAMRVGYFTAPDAYLTRAQNAFAASILFTSPLLAEMAATWIEDGTAMRIVAQKRAEAMMRNRAVRRILPRATADLRSAHLWLTLPEGWSPNAFAEEARRRRVRVASAASFAVGKDIPRAVRISVGAPPTIADLETALHILASIGEERFEEHVV